MTCVLSFLERSLAESLAPIVIPFDDCVFFISPLDCAEFASRLSKISQSFDTMSLFELLICGGGLGERWPFGYGPSREFRQVVREAVAMLYGV